MKKIEATYNPFSCFSGLPDEIVLEILNKIIDLKTLCVCKLVCKRFSSIILQVDIISYTAPLVINPKPNNKDVVLKLLDLIRSMMNADMEKNLSSSTASFECKSFRSSLKSMNKFRWVKSLCIEIPSSFGVDDRRLFKWMINFGNNSDSFIFISPNSICCHTNTDTSKESILCEGVNENVVDREEEKLMKVHNVIRCFIDAITRFKMLLCCIDDFPLLEKVSITDSGKRGKVSLTGAKITEFRNLLPSPFETMLETVSSMAYEWYVPLLVLPVSGYVMKGVTLVYFKSDLPNGNDNFMKIDEDDDFEDKEEASYNEAVMEIFKKHRGLMKRLT